MEKDLNNIFNKRTVNSFKKLVNDIEAYRIETGEDKAMLYEDINTFFYISDIKLINGKLYYMQDGKQEIETLIIIDENGEAFEYDELSEWIKFWRKCLNRAKKIWLMDCDTIDRLQEEYLNNENTEII